MREITAEREIGRKKIGKIKRERESRKGVEGGAV